MLLSSTKRIKAKVIIALKKEWKFKPKPIVSLSLLALPNQVSLETKCLSISDFVYCVVFKYVKEQHNAYEVEEKTFRTCDASRGVLAKYESGNDRVTLTEEKKYWFICNVGGHCLGGMRFTIDVKQASPSSDNTGSTDGSPTSQPTELPVTPPTSSSRSSLLSESWKIGIYSLASGMLFKLYCWWN